MTKDEKSRIAAMRRDGMGYTKIAQELGLSENTVKSYCRRNGLSKEALLAEPSAPDTPVEKKCLHCGAAFTQYPNCKVKKFCSADCRNRYWNRHINDERRKAMETYVCPGCGKTFYAYAGHHRKYCSHACYIASRFGGAVCE